MYNKKTIKKLKIIKWCEINKTCQIETGEEVTTDWVVSWVVGLDLAAPFGEQGIGNVTPVSFPFANKPLNPFSEALLALLRPKDAETTELTDLLWRRKCVLFVGLLLCRNVVWMFA